MRIRNIGCLLGAHRVYLDFSQCVRPEANVIVGPVRRFCDRCGRTLPGEVPQVGDRKRLHEEDSLPESHN